MYIYISGDQLRTIGEKLQKAAFRKGFDVHLRESNKVHEESTIHYFCAWQLKDAKNLQDALSNQGVGNFREPDRIKDGQKLHFGIPHLEVYVASE